MNRGEPERPLVSVCVTSYNYGCYLRDAVESALSQTYPHIEVVISDNGSTDNTRDVIGAYRDDPRVRFFVNETNVGLCANHNRAIERARGDYLVILSADDVLFPQHVERLLARIRDPFDPVEIAGGEGVIFNEDLRSIGTLMAFGALPFAYSRRDDFGPLLRTYYHMMPAKLFARSVFDRVGSFDERVVRGIDMEFLARVEASGVATAFIPELVAGMRKHGNNVAVRCGDVDEYSWNDSYADRLACYELALAPEHAWRLEGYETIILSIAQMEFERLPEPVDPTLAERLRQLQSALESFAATTPQWPEAEPQLSIVVLSEGYLQLLEVTLEALAAQQADRIEIVVVQTSGYDIGQWVRRLPSGARVRLIAPRACTTPTAALRYGLEVARGEYVAYLLEGQRVGDALYATCLYYARAENAQLILYPKSSIDNIYPTLIVPEGRDHQFGDPRERAQAWNDADGFTFSQCFHRRGILRSGTVLHEAMAVESEHAFLTLLAQHYRTLTLSHAN
jgi:hypothetical protein